MQISDNCVNLVSEFEGERLNAYDDKTGRVCGINDILLGTLTIGYGHTGQDVYKGMSITHEQALRILKQDLMTASQDVQKAIDTKVINFPVNQNQFDALVSFCFNLGFSNICMLCKDRSPQEVCEHMTAYVNKGSVWEEGLTRRRNAEKDLFLKPCESEGDYMSKVYHNGKTQEIIYADINNTKEVGKLNPFETAEAIADVNGRIVVLYDGLDVNGKPCKKTGFTIYRGGL